jgi:hypothetical protein
VLGGGIKTHNYDLILRVGLGIVPQDLQTISSNLLCVLLPAIYTFRIFIYLTTIGHDLFLNNCCNLVAGAKFNYNFCVRIFFFKHKRDHLSFFIRGSSGTLKIANRYFKEI